MKYALLLYSDPADAPAPDTPEDQEEFAAWMRISEEMAPLTAGGEALHPTETATTVRVDGKGDAVLTDGPFAETKEVLGGFYIIDVDDLEAATAWAAKMPHMPRGGSVEIRPVMEFDGA